MRVVVTLGLAEGGVVDYVIGCEFSRPTVAIELHAIVPLPWSVLFRLHTIFCGMSLMELRWVVSLR